LNVVKLAYNGKFHTLSGINCEEERDPTFGGMVFVFFGGMVFSALQLKRLMRKKNPTYLAVVKEVPDSGTPSNDNVDVHITALQEQFADVLDGVPPGHFPPERDIDHAIDIIPGSTPPSRGIIRLSPDELEELNKQIKELLARGYIRPSISPYAAPVLCAKKKDGGLRLCIDYRASTSSPFATNSFFPESMSSWTDSTVPPATHCWTWNRVTESYG
jgi:hypothetical protein